jgi:hypothetical protein
MPLKCLDCKAVCRGEEQLRIHLHDVHYKLRPYRCQSCRKQTETESTLREHYREIHGQERGFQVVGACWTGLLSFIFPPHRLQIVYHYSLADFEARQEIDRKVREALAWSQRQKPELMTVHESFGEGSGLQVPKKAIKAEVGLPGSSQRPTSSKAAAGTRQREVTAEEDQPGPSQRPTRAQLASPEASNNEVVIIGTSVAGTPDARKQLGLASDHFAIPSLCLYSVCSGQHQHPLSSLGPGQGEVPALRYGLLVRPAPGARQQPVGPDCWWSYSALIYPCLSPSAT